MIITTRNFGEKCFTKIYAVKEGGFIVELIQQFETNNTKWNQESVCDLYITRCTLPDSAVGNLTFMYDDIDERLHEIYSCKPKFYEDIEKQSILTTEIQISLPTGSYIPGQPRRVVDTFYPLVVKVNNKDYSPLFADLAELTTTRVEEANKMLHGKFDRNIIKNDIFCDGGVDLLTKLGIIDKEKAVIASCNENYNDENLADFDKSIGFTPVKKNKIDKLSEIILG